MPPVTTYTLRYNDSYSNQSTVDDYKFTESDYLSIVLLRASSGSVTFVGSASMVSERTARIPAKKRFEPLAISWLLERNPLCLCVFH